MTDRPNHRAAAERMLADADEWTAQAGELSPEASELSCLAYGILHALLAIHDTLTAADRYAANEAKQREEAETDTPSGRAFTARDKGATDAVRAKINALSEWMTVALTPEPDPLDEDDHRDRLDRDGDIWQRVHEGCWMEPGFPPESHGPAECLQLAALPGPLTFAPDADGAPDVTPANPDTIRAIRARKDRP